MDTSDSEIILTTVNYNLLRLVRQNNLVSVGYGMYKFRTAKPAIDHRVTGKILLQ